MKLFISIFMLSVFSCSAFGQSLKAPSGWRFPIAKDYQGDWKTRRKDGTRPFKTQGDFNDDKIRDEAWILIPTGGAATGAGLFVFLGQPNKIFRVVQLDYLEGAKAQNLYVDVVAKGAYETACGKGYWTCAAGEPAKLDLPFQAISYGTFESSELIYYWDAQRKTFRNAAISD